MMNCKDLATASTPSPTATNPDKCPPPMPFGNVGACGWGCKTMMMRGQGLCCSNNMNNTMQQFGGLPQGMSEQACNQLQQQQLCLLHGCYYQCHLSHIAALRRLSPKFQPSWDGCEAVGATSVSDDESYDDDSACPPISVSQPSMFRMGMYPKYQALDKTTRFFLEGRGGFGNHHKGNRHVREMVRKEARFYINADPADRGDFGASLYFGRLREETVFVVKKEYVLNLLEADMAGLAEERRRSKQTRGAKKYKRKLSAKRTRSILEQHGGIETIRMAPSDCYLHVGATWAIDTLDHLFRGYANKMRKRQAGDTDDQANSGDGKERTNCVTMPAAPWAALIPTASMHGSNNQDFNGSDGPESSDDCNASIMWDPKFLSDLDGFVSLHDEDFRSFDDTTLPSDDLLFPV